jgi:hypothetical protein
MGNVTGRNRRNQHIPQYDYIILYPPSPALTSTRLETRSNARPWYVLDLAAQKFLKPNVYRTSPVNILSFQDADRSARHGRTQE